MPIILCYELTYLDCSYIDAIDQGMILSLIASARVNEEWAMRNFIVKCLLGEQTIEANLVSSIMKMKGAMFTITNLLHRLPGFVASR
jgi:hypothetical protein